MSAGCFFAEADSRDLAEDDIVRRHFLDIDHPAIEGGKCVGQHGRTGGRHLETGAGETVVIGKRRAPGKGIGNALVVGTERVQREDAAAEEDLVLRIGVVEADQHRGRIVRDRAGGGDGDAAAQLAHRRRHELHMAGITAHGIAIKAGVDMLPVQHLLLPCALTLP